MIDTISPPEGVMDGRGIMVRKAAGGKMGLLKG
jgi:hypothetical protein